MSQAVCCSDHLHCCPEGYTCDVAQATCKMGDTVIPFVGKMEATPKVSDVVCPDKTSTCPDNTTCCQQGSGKYGCCPWPKAVCCTDHEHCCPEGYTCDLTHSTCKMGDTIIPFMKKVAATPAVSDIICPDKTSKCPDNSTCCVLPSGKYGCCLFGLKSVCCSDKLSCCPEGWTCDVEKESCHIGDQSIPALKKVEATPTVTASDIVCPDKTSTCPDDTTCCQMASGQYGCCPFPKAVCCSDHEHCCPEGHTCDLSSSSCTQGDVSIPLLTKVPANKLQQEKEEEKEVSQVECPGGKTMCPNGYTCCAKDKGEYGCCPFAEAVCCDDKIHCCPSGYTCDPKKAMCTKSMVTVSVPWSEKVPAKPVGSQDTDIVCPGGKTTCQAGSTCCQMASGEYGCCPYDQAVCCSDKLHCCPSGTTCDVAHAKCNSVSNSLSISWEDVKRPGKMTTGKLSAIKCKDGTECPWGSTCCMLDSGKYGCCPMANATCCDDHIHCCPEGYKCDSKNSSCTKAGSSVSVEMTLHSRSRAHHPTVHAGNTCADKSTQCPKGSTCCKMTSGTYGCCPMTEASCCPDGVHCCPHGTHCDEKTAKCSQHIPFSTKVPALKLGNGEIATTTTLSVVCPDRQHQCPDFNTCCLMQAGHWGCCPLPKAICCKDGQHCCPQGFRCGQRTCVRGLHPPSELDDDDQDSTPAFLLYEGQTLN